MSQAYDISVQGDSRNLASHPAHVKAALDQRFPDLDTRSAEEWASVFRVGE